MTGKWAGQVGAFGSLTVVFECATREEKKRERARERERERERERYR
jgi:hypothetical protein